MSGIRRQQPILYPGYKPVNHEVEPDCTDPLYVIPSSLLKQRSLLTLITLSIMSIMAVAVSRINLDRNYGVSPRGNHRASRAASNGLSSLQPLIEAQRVQKTKKKDEAFDDFIYDLPFRMLMNVTDWPVERSEVPIFWHAPRAGDADAGEIIEACHLNNEINFTDPVALKEAQRDNSHLRMTSDSNNYNQNDKLDIIVSPYLVDVARLLSPIRKGRAFAFIRNPMERELANYHRLTTMPRDHPNYNSAYDSMTLRGYVHSKHAGSNFLTRFLIEEDHNPGYKVTPDDLERAKAILRQKVLVLMPEYMDESINGRLKFFFSSSGWDAGASFACIGELFNEPYQDRQRSEFPVLEHNSYEWNALSLINHVDIKLYKYAKKLFQIQGELLKIFHTVESAVEGVPDIPQQLEVTLPQQQQVNQISGEIPPPQPQINEGVPPQEPNAAIAQQQQSAPPPQQVDAAPVQQEEVPPQYQMDAVTPAQYQMDAVTPAQQQQEVKRQEQQAASPPQPVTPEQEANIAAARQQAIAENAREQAIASNLRDQAMKHERAAHVANVYAAQQKAIAENAKEQAIAANANQQQLAMAANAAAEATNKVTEAQQQQTADATLAEEQANA